MPDSATSRVLIADDDAAIRRLVSAVCKRLGFRYDAVADGAEALEKLTGGVYDLLLLDLMMPNVSGYQVIEALAKQPNRPRVIIVTAAGPRNIIEAHRSDVVHGVLIKPFELEALSALIVEMTRPAGEPGAPRT